MKRIGLTIVTTIALLLTLFTALAFADSGASLNAPQDISDVRINEVRIDQPSTDNDEYFELQGPVGQSLDGLTYLVLGDGTGASGVIEVVVDLTGQALDANGFFVAAEATFSLGTADLTTNLNFENSDNVTHMLVEGFTGADGDDLDTNDDGVLDVTPWTSIIDVIALIEEENPPSGTEWHYGPPTVGPDGSNVPGHAFYCDSGWEIGAFDPVGGDDTPGAANSACPVSASELVVTKMGPLTAVAEDTLVYEITLENSGSLTATNVVLTDTLPLSTTFVSDNIGTPTNPATGVYVWNLGDLLAADTVTYQVTVTVASDVVEGQTLTNLVEVSTDEPGDTAAGNSDTAVTTIFAPFTADTNLAFTQIGRFVGSGAEILDHDPISQTLYVVTGGPFMEILDISDPFSPTLKYTIPITPYGAAANSVAIYDGIVAAAVENITKTLPGEVVFFDRDGVYLGQITVGALPDMLTYTPDGQYILVANEGEPEGADDPEGSVSVIDMSGGVVGASVTTLGFTHFTTDTIDTAVRIFPGKTVAEDVEPEYITIAPDGQTAWVTLQEANAVAIVDMQAMTITAVVPLGFKDHSLSGNELDPSDRDSGININNWPVWGMYMPDAIASYEVDGTVYLLTANEGDARTEDARIKDVTLDATAFPDAATLQLDENIGRLDMSTIDGLNQDGFYEELYVYGARSFSIWNGSTGALVYDSGAEFEQATAVLTPDIFNYNSGDIANFDTRSDNKGPEPEGVVTGVIGDKTYAFIGLERAGGIMVYDVTDPIMPTFVNYLPPMDENNDGIAEDISPEGLHFIAAADSPTGNPLLAVAHELSGSTVLYEITFTVTFVYHDLEDVVQTGEEIFIAGNFNGFNNNIDQLTPDATYDVFTITLSGMPAFLDYKYVVDISGQKEWDWLNTSNRQVTLDGPTTLEDFRNVTPGYAVLSGPATLTTPALMATDPISGQLYIQSVTNPAGEPRSVLAQVGYGDDTNLDGWNWIDADHIGQDGNNDIYEATLTPTVVGVFSYTNRFNGNWGEGNPHSLWTYGDLNGVGPYPGGEFSLADVGVLTVTEPDYCAMEPSHFIHEIQGSGASTPISGQAVSVRAIVVGDFQEGGYDGFYIQEEDEDHDADPLTSEGVFVYFPANTVDVALGDAVYVAGTAGEFSGQTQITSVSVVAVCGTGSVTPATVDMPVTAVSDLEAFEGMSVIIPAELTVTDNFNMGRFGEIILSSSGRQFNFTSQNAPDVAGFAAHQAEIALNRIILDDGRTGQNPPVPMPYLDPDGTLRAGSTITDLTAVLGYGFNAYRLQPTQVYTFSVDNPRAPVADVGGDLKVASFNVLNYFTTLGSRGADTLEELERQRDKLVSAILGLNADVVGLIEIENHPDDEALIDLVDSLNAVAGPDTYDYLATGPIGTDAIKVAFIYQPARATAVGSHAILDNSFDPAYQDDLNRPALAQTFSLPDGDEVVTVIINHFKSKGSCPADGEDADQLDGQGCWNPTRTQAAAVMLDWLATDPTSSGSDNFLIMGDLNSYGMEDPIMLLENGDYLDLLKETYGDQAYSYSFFGEFGHLDYALASAALQEKVAGAAVWFINADEPRALDYNDFNQEFFFNPDEFRASDHDPVLVGLNLEPAETMIYLPIIINGEAEASTAVPAPRLGWLTIFFGLPLMLVGLPLARRQQG